MIEFELLRDQGVLIVSPTGPLTEADFARLAQRSIDSPLVCVDAFPGWDSFAALSHAKCLGANFSLPGWVGANVPKAAFTSLF
jgi:hypothetical protein